LRRDRAQGPAGPGGHRPAGPRRAARRYGTSLTLNARRRPPPPVPRAAPCVTPPFVTPPFVTPPFVTPPFVTPLFVTPPSADRVRRPPAGPRECPRSWPPMSAGTSPAPSAGAAGP